MAEKDRSERRKEEVAYFIPKRAKSYACIGPVGYSYNFTKENPAKVTLSPDIAFFRSKHDVVEVDASGVPISERPHGMVAETGTVPSTSPLNVSDEDAMVMKTDKPKKKKPAPIPEPDEDEDEEEDEEEEEEEKPKKKKKKVTKKKKKSEKPSGKKKKKKKSEVKKKKKKKPVEDEDEEDDWDEED